MEYLLTGLYHTKITRSNSIDLVFSVLYLKEDFRWKTLVGFLFIIAAAFFIFKKW